MSERSAQETNKVAVRSGWSLKNIIVRGGGVVLAAVLIWWTIHRTGADPWTAVAGADWRYLCVAFALLGVTHVLGSWRWGLGLAVQGLHCSLWLLYRLTLVGSFFSQLIPGGVSGDVIKLAWVVRQNPGKGAGAVMSGMLDRVVGVAGLFLQASLGGVVYCLVVPGALDGDASKIQLGLGLVFAGGAVSFVVLVSMLYHRAFLRIPLASGILSWLGRIMPSGVVSFFTKLCEAAEAYRHHKSVLVKALVISMFIHFLIGTTLFCIGRGLGETRCSYGAYFMGQQLGTSVTLIPATPGGLGMRDSVTVTFIQAFARGTEGIDAGLLGSIPLVYSLLTILWSLLGGAMVPFLMGKRTEQ